MQWPGPLTHSVRTTQHILLLCVTLKALWSFRMLGTFCRVTVTHSRRLVSWATLVWEPHISQVPQATF